MRLSTTRIIPWIVNIGISPDDDDDLRLQKSLLVVCSLPFAFIGLAWGLLYFYFNQPLAGLIPFSYGVVSWLSIAVFGLTRRYSLFRFSQLSLILLLPFFLMLSLGGFVGGSAVILWALVCPMGAMLFDKPNNALLWFLAFLCLVVLSSFLQPYLNITNNLPSAAILLFFVINIIGVSSIIFLMVFYFVGQKKMYQERSEALLLNILPKDIVTILKSGSRNIAQQFENASVLFADLVNFTPMSATMTPTEIVKLLNEVFSYFDSLADKYGLEKIKTIGDCYMIAAGIPRSRTDHAHVITRMALEMRDYVNKREFHGRKLTFRIGINSGPVVAGVIGRKKFIYDLWGETVNTASRMESHGEGGTIQITRGLYELIKDEFVCNPRGKVNVKGVGETETWFVVNIKQ